MGVGGRGKRLSGDTNKSEPAHTCILLASATQTPTHAHLLTPTHPCTRTHAPVPQCCQPCSLLGHQVHHIHPTAAAADWRRHWHSLANAALTAAAAVVHTTQIPSCLCACCHLLSCNQPLLVLAAVCLHRSCVLHNPKPQEPQALSVSTAHPITHQLHHQAADTTQRLLSRKLIATVLQQLL